MKQPSYFNLLWMSSIINGLGDKTSLLTMPLIAVYFFHTDVTKTAFVTTMQFLPYLFFSVYFANIVSKTRKKQVLLGITNIASALLTITLILLILSNSIQLWMFYLFLFSINSLSVLAGITYSTLLVYIVEEDKLMDANSKLAISNSLLRLSAPSIGGAIIEYLGYLFALLFDTITFFIAGSMQFFIHANNEIKETKKKNNLKTAFRIIYQNKLLFTIFTSFLCTTISLGLFQSIQVFHLTRTLAFSGSEIGVIFSIGTLGMITMSFISKKFIKKMGVYKSINSFVVSIIVVCILYFLVQFISNGYMKFGIILIAQILIFLFNPMFTVATATINQTNVKKEDYSSVVAVWGCLTRGILPISSILGGLIYEYTYISGVMVVCFLIMIVCYYNLYIHKNRFEISISKEAL